MDDPNVKQYYETKKRDVYVATPGQVELGPLKWLPGHWQAKGTGWNMIALPFAAPRGNFRVLMNQYDEDLNFTFIDNGVPNRGIDEVTDVDTDQFVVTLDYQQQIKQVAVEDFPVSGKAGDVGAAIHHEPGLWLNMKNENTNGIDIARLGTIPHGDSVLALGTSQEIAGKPTIPGLNGLPIGAPGNGDITHPYLAPYKHFEDNKFFGTVPTNIGFPGFFPTDLNAILRFALAGLPEVKTTTILEVDTTREKANVVNIPFIEREADASSMKSTFWIMELKDPDADGKPQFVLQYSQVVMLDFFPRADGLPGLIRWPHVSIATLNKKSDKPQLPYV
ncbi:MAG: heme-binding protein [Alphaproteobacteria bacterium]